MSTEKQRLVLYDGIRNMHAQLSALMTENESVLKVDEWLLCAINTLDGVMYLAESAVLQDNGEIVCSMKSKSDYIQLQKSHFIEMRDFIYKITTGQITFITTSVFKLAETIEEHIRQKVSQ